MTVHSTLKGHLLVTSTVGTLCEDVTPDTRSDGRHRLPTSSSQPWGWVLTFFQLTVQETGGSN